jgi:hypothetical protein
VDLLLQEGISTQEFLHEGFENAVPRAVNLGPIRSIKYEDACPLCPLLKAIVPERKHDDSDSDFLYLIPALALARMEPSILLYQESYENRTSELKVQKPLLQYCQIVYPATIVTIPVPGTVTRTDVCVPNYFTLSHEARNALAVAHGGSSRQNAMGGREILDDCIDYDILRN